jgi:hypothetical protein
MSTLEPVGFNQGNDGLHEGQKVMISTKLPLILSSEKRREKRKEKRKEATRHGT